MMDCVVESRKRIQAMRDEWRAQLADPNASRIDKIVAEKMLEQTKRDVRDGD